MAKKVSFLFIALSVLIAQTGAIVFVNNETVSSDILTKLFIKEIQSNRILVDTSVPNHGVLNSEKCFSALQQIVNRLPSVDVLPFFDSWGTLPSGLLYGHTHDFGNFDECTRISMHLDASTGFVNGQYCLATASLKQDQQNTVLTQIGICAPDVCDASAVEKIFHRATENIFNGSLSGVKLSDCTTGQKPDFTAVDIFAIVVFSIFGVLLVISTGYDVYTEYFKNLLEPAVPLLLAFSVLTNGRKLFAVGTQKLPNSIDCLSGIRVFSMIWIVYFHNRNVYVIASPINQVEFSEWQKSASGMHVVEGAIAVDTFIFMSGLLVAWLGLRELDKSKGNINILMMYFHRYIRLTPSLAAVVLFHITFENYIGSGPLKQQSLGINGYCKANWWSTLLYVQNYVHPNHTCGGQTWYLAVDTQLYIISPLILTALWKWGRKCVPAMIVVCLLSIGCVTGMYFLDSITEDYIKLVYAPTHTRFSAWLVGVGLGYFMYEYRSIPVRPSKLAQLLGWTFCFVTIVGVVYIPVLLQDKGTPVVASGMFEGLKRPLWAIAISWLVFACHFGFGGVINAFLSHPWWQPLGRLTYSMYSVHVFVLTTNFGIVRTDLYFSNYDLLLILCGTLGISLMVALVWHFAFESPVLVIEKVLLGSDLKAKTVIALEKNGQLPLKST